MRAVIQRVSQASVTIAGDIVGSIDRGLVVLLGIEHADDAPDVDEHLTWLVGKIARMRIFPDDAGAMNRGVQEVAGGVLVVSQFTLHASTKKGNRPGFTTAAPPAVAEPLYERFVTAMAAAISGPVATGRFGASMQVALINDGPVTIIIDSRRRE